MTNSTVSGNSTAGISASGGGIFVAYTGGVTLTNSTISGNSTAGVQADGGGIALGEYGAYSAAGVAANSIIAGNSATSSNEPDVAGRVSASNGLNIFGSDVDGSTPSDRENVPTSLLFSGELADNGGPTQTIALRDDPANPTLGRADPAFAPTTDQRGEPRPQPEGTSPDIGAFELTQSHSSPQPVGETFVVTSSSDVSGNDGVLTLREALALADADSATPDRIVFACEVQGHTIALGGSQLTVTSDVTVDGGTGITIDANHQSRVLLVKGLGTDVMLQDLTITGGRTTGNYERGGGIHADRLTTLTLDHVTVTDNRTSGDNASGGGIYGYRTTLTSSMVDDNEAAGYLAAGGGIFGGYVTLTDSVVRGNSASGAGGIFGVVTLDNSSVTGNEADGIGGGISGSGTIINSTVSNNHAGDFAGGISGGGLMLVNSTVSGNSMGGAFGSNSGGIFGSGTLINSTVTGNSGGGIDVSTFEQFALYNSIIAGNGGADVRAYSASIASNGHNIFGSDVEGNAPGDLENVSASLLFAGGLADNGGPTQTIALRNTLDNPALAGADAADAPATDQRGEQRPQPDGTNPDIGSFELDQSERLNEIVGTNRGEFLRGTSGPDVIRALGGADRLWGRPGDDALFGGLGNDVLAGNAGIDRLTGSEGADRFLFRRVSDAPVASPDHDEVLDFSRAEGDKLDLRRIDADSGMEGNQKFSIVVGDAFTHAGQIRVEATFGGSFLVSGNVDKDLDADVAFVVRTDLAHLESGDFLL